MHSLLTREVSVLELKGKIESQAQQEMTDAQKQYYLRQQMKAIQEELGEGEGDEIKDLRARVAAASLPDHVRTVADRELDRLAAHGSGFARIPDDPHLHRLAARAALGDRRPRIALDPVEARRVLDEDHYDLDKVKERIVEYLAVRKLKGDMKGPILCFVGPPGVGKTSLGQSIARAMQRKFVRISLGGVRDEAEIRGHRRTYIGSMPGRIVQALKQAGSANPVFMLDELDKITVGYQGDPAAALLEVLDPAQNNTLPRSLPGGADRSVEGALHRDREPDRAGAPGAARSHGDRVAVRLHRGRKGQHRAPLSDSRASCPSTACRSGAVTFTDEALRADHRRIHAGSRRAKPGASDRHHRAEDRGTRRRRARRRIDPMVEANELEDYLGPARFKREVAFRTSRPGVATGVAWTETGGDVLFIEASLLPGGRGQFILTGQLGDVMQESARAAVSHIRANAASSASSQTSWKDATCTCTCPPARFRRTARRLASPWRRRSCRPRAAKHVRRRRGDDRRDHVERTGAAGGRHPREGAGRQALRLQTFILPALNEPDLKELPEEIRKDMRFVPVETLEEVLKSPCRCSRARARAATQRDEIAQNQGEEPSSRTAENRRQNSVEPR